MDGHSAIMLNIEKAKVIEGMWSHDYKTHMQTKCATCTFLRGLVRNTRMGLISTRNGDVLSDFRRMDSELENRDPQKGVQSGKVVAKEITKTNFPTKLMDEFKEAPYGEGFSCDTCELFRHYITRAKNNHGEVSGECEDKYGINLMDNWAQDMQELCRDEYSEVRCGSAINGKWALCSMSNVRMDTDFKDYANFFYEPKYGKVTCRATWEDTRTNHGRLSTTITSKGVLFFDQYLQHLQYGASSEEVYGKCENWVEHPVMFYPSYTEFKNPYHAYEEFVDVFLVMATMAREIEGQVELVHYGVESLQNTTIAIPLHLLAGQHFKLRSLKDNPFPRNTCFRQLLIAPHAGMSLFSVYGVGVDQPCYSSVIAGMRDYFYNQFVGPKRSERLIDHVDKKTGRLVRRVAIVVRRKLGEQLLTAHQLNRVMENSEEVVDEIKKMFEKEAPCRDKIAYEVFPVYFEDHTLPAQAILVSGVDVLVGVHGAGLVHSMYLKPKESKSRNVIPGGLVHEIFPPGTQSNLMYENLCAACNVHYKNVFLKEKVIDARQTFNAVLEVLKEGIPSSILTYINR
eukprot:Nk52_evm39s1485 gene=Nk52_evmTU39s1485